MSGLRRWRDALIQGAALQGGAYGCALGNLVVELADVDDQARTLLSEHFESWEGLLANGFRRMIDDGILPANADPDALATGLMAALQGGYLLAQAEHDVAPMATALDMALAYIESLANAATNGKTVRSATRQAADSATKPHTSTATRRTRTSKSDGSAAAKR
jgi:aryl-alcohol dehydrogenase-like predicted oxidoreductase